MSAFKIDLTRHDENTDKIISRGFSCSQIASLEASCTSTPSAQKAMEKHHHWTLCDAASTGDYAMYTPRHEHKRKLPLASFNHIAREVLSLEQSKQFYVDILGFTVVPRPPFDCDGYWLYGYGLSLHLVATSYPPERKRIKIARIQHFSTALPRVDHIAFITHDLDYVQQTLDDAKVYYKRDSPADGAIEQIFLFDPDGNVIEISNCAPPIGEIRCVQLEASEDEIVQVPPSLLALEAAAATASPSKLVIEKALNDSWEEEEEESTSVAPSIDIDSSSSSTSVVSGDNSPDEE